VLIGTVMMVAKAFVDTSILLRALHPSFALHQQVEALIQKMWREETVLWINRQVIREYLVQATHPRTFSTLLTVQQVMNQMEVILSLFRVADEGAAVTMELLRLLQNYPTSGKQIHDTNIVATMTVYEIDTLLTLNLMISSDLGTE
jgi:predicted nucleic acid-binding protein